MKKIKSKIWDWAKNNVVCTGIAFVFFALLYFVVLCLFFGAALINDIIYLPCERGAKNIYKKFFQGDPYDSRKHYHENCTPEKP